MTGQERREKILALLDEHGKVNVSELAKEMDVSNKSIRRDLQELEEKGLLVRFRGGAVKPEEAQLTVNQLKLDTAIETESPEAESPEVESPEAESPEVETLEAESPEAELLEAESPKAEASETTAAAIETAEEGKPRVIVKKSKPEWLRRAIENHQARNSMGLAPLPKTQQSEQDVAETKVEQPIKKDELKPKIEDPEVPTSEKESTQPSEGIEPTQPEEDKSSTQPNEETKPTQTGKETKPTKPKRPKKPTKDIDVIEVGSPITPEAKASIMRLAKPDRKPSSTTLDKTKWEVAPKKEDVKPVPVAETRKKKRSGRKVSKEQQIQIDRKKNQGKEGRLDREERLDKKKKSGRREKPDREKSVKREESVDKEERIDREKESGKKEKLDRKERVEREEKADRKERVEREEKPDRKEGIVKEEKLDRKERRIKEERPDRKEKPAKKDKLDKEEKKSKGRRVLDLIHIFLALLFFIGGVGLSIFFLQSLREPGGNVQQELLTHGELNFYLPTDWNLLDEGGDETVIQIRNSQGDTIGSVTITTIPGDLNLSLEGNFDNLSTRIHRDVTELQVNEIILSGSPARMYTYNSVSGDREGYNSYLVPSGGNLQYIQLRKPINGFNQDVLVQFNEIVMGLNFLPSEFISESD